MAMKEFHLAAQAEASAEESIEFSIGEQVFHAQRATTSQVSLVLSAVNEGGSAIVSAVYLFLEGVLPEEDYRILRRMIAKGKIPIELIIGGDDDNELGIVDWIVQESSNTPTQPLSGSSSSPASGGKK